MDPSALFPLRCGITLNIRLKHQKNGFLEYYVATYKRTSG